MSSNSSLPETQQQQQQSTYMNTYKLWANNPFSHDKVKKILKNVMTDAIENLTYDPETCKIMALDLSQAIRTKVQELKFDRYKIICIVTIGEKKGQTVKMITMGLWDKHRDSYAVFSIENNNVYGVAECYGIYYE